MPTTLFRVPGSFVRFSSALLADDEFEVIEIAEASDFVHRPILPVVRDVSHTLNTRESS